MLTKIKEFIKEAINAFRAHSVYMQYIAGRVDDDRAYMKEMLELAKRQQASIPKEIIDANRRYDIAKWVLINTINYKINEDGTDAIDYESSVANALGLADELVKQLNNAN